MDNHPKNTLHLRRLGIDTYREAVIYMRKDCHICLSEGFEAQARVRVFLGERSIIATLNIITSELLEPDTAGLSEHAWKLLAAKEGDEITVRHPEHLTSFGFVRGKIYGNALDAEQTAHIVGDIVAGRYSDIHTATFLTACATAHLSLEETTHLTRAMILAGDRLTWHSGMVVDKHCVGGLPGNRTTPIVVAIVAAYGLTIPKTSSRAITSPSGTADTMEVLTNVELDVAAMKRVVERENGCLAWGGAVSLSPADDILIRVEKTIELDSEGQLVASVLSKKIAAGSTHTLIDIPIGPTAKVRSRAQAEGLKAQLQHVGDALGIAVEVLCTDGAQPVGYGIGPALEARDIVAVLQNAPEAPPALREKSLLLAGKVLEFSPDIVPGTGVEIAAELLASGKAWRKFQAICQAQGGMKDIPQAPYTHTIAAHAEGEVIAIDNRRIARVAKLAGAPNDKVAGVDLHAPLGAKLRAGAPLFTIHAASSGELEYALHYLRARKPIVEIG